MAGDLDRTPYRLVFADDFGGSALDADRWVDHYLPHWTTPERSAARYRLGPGGLQLRIEADQPAWRPEDGELRVSNLQTGSWSGPLGSPRGQHRHRPELVVRSPQPTRRGWTPSGGLVEVTASGTRDPTGMLAFWLVGFEEVSADQSGEICVAELYGNAMSRDRSQVRLGVKPHHDPGLHHDMTDVMLPLDTGDQHTYAAAWDADRVRFYVDEQLVRTVDQGLQYPLQLMVDLFEFPTDGPRVPAEYPKTASVTQVRGWSSPG